MQTTKIINLTDDCLVKIFKLLELKDLLSVAVTNEWLRPAARDVYKREFGKEKVFIDGIQRPKTCQYDIQMAPEESHTKESLIKICGLKTSLQYLRCFGGSIKELSFDYHGFRSKRNQFVHQYINEYCVESLTKLEFIRKPSSPIEHFEKPFVNVTSVKVSDSDLGEQLPSFVEWFPNLQSLKLFGTYLTDGFSNAPFHHLEELEICEGGKDGSTIDDVTTLLSSNRQLRDVTIHMAKNKISTMSKLLHIIKDNPLIVKLCARIPTYRGNGVYSYATKKLNPSDLQRLENEHPNLVSLSLPRCYKMTAEDAEKLIPQLKSLKFIEASFDDSGVDDRLKRSQINGWIYKRKGAFSRCGYRRFEQRRAHITLQRID